MKRLPAFTMVELLVALALGMVVLLLAVGISGGAGRAVYRIGGDLSCEREARAALGCMQRDLASARCHPPPLFRHATSPGASDQAAWLCLLSADRQRLSDRLGDACVVRYFLRDLPQGGGRVMRCLMRGRTDSARVFASLRTQDSIEPLIEPQENDELLARSVVSFRVRPVRRAPDGSWADWSPGVDNPPDAVVLSLVLLRDADAARLRTSADWDAESSMGWQGTGSQDDAAHPDGRCVREEVMPFGNDESR